METTFECWTATAALARDTQRVNIGQMVGCNGYRNPALYAKIASTVDVASHGRLYAGIGAGWYEHEWKAYGYEWPDVHERMGAFREAVEIIHRMWTEDDAGLQRQVLLDRRADQRAEGRPQAAPRFWIGGGGEKVTLQAGRAVRRRLQRRRRRPRRHPQQARRAARALRRGRPRLRRDHQVDQDQRLPDRKGRRPGQATEKALGRGGAVGCGLAGHGHQG